MDPLSLSSWAGPLPSSAPLPPRSLRLQDLRTYSAPVSTPGGALSALATTAWGREERQGPKDLRCWFPMGSLGALLGRGGSPLRELGREVAEAQATPAGAESRSTYCARGPQQ